MSPPDARHADPRGPVLTCRLLGWTARVPGGPIGLPDALRAGKWRGAELADPARPASIDPGRWRRMSRLSRLAADAVGELLDAAPGLDRASVPLVHGGAMGEVVPSSAFLDRLFLEGPATASPLAFQNSVTNATAAHLSLAFGLRGHAETVSAGMATGLAALARACELLAREPEVLIVVGDDLNPTTRKAYANTPCPAGELVVAARIGRGLGLWVADGVVGGPGQRVARGVALPYERGFVALEGLRPEAVIGLNPAGGLLSLLALPGARVVDVDDGLALTAGSIALS